MSVLLRQAHGFEGLGSTKETLGFDYLSPPYREDPAHRGVEFHSAPAPARPDMPQGEDAIVEIAKLAPLVPDVLEALEGVRDPPAKALVASVDVSLGTTNYRRPKLALRVDVREHFFHVGFHVAWDRLDNPTNYLHVLPRHRPRSIPQAQESA